MSYKLGSLFDGSGGFPLAGSLCGIEPRWASEVEPYPIAVTRERFPQMKHLGDISKINGAEIEPVDIITFGSPCQDLSIAGKRAGLKHEANGDDETTRSGLFMEAVRIIKEMRKATNGKYPRFALWENVPGAFSSNKGEDFRVVCEELIKIAEPTALMPPVPKAGWAYADSYVGDGWSLAYRVFDAQYWGVPQRRRRIHLVVDFRGERAREVLFERQGVRGYFEQGCAPWQGSAADTEKSAGATDRGGDRLYAVGKTYGFDPQACRDVGQYVHEDLGNTLTNGTNPGWHNGVAYTLKIRSGCEGGGKGALVQTDKSATISTLNDQYLFQPVMGADTEHQEMIGTQKADYRNSNRVEMIQYIVRRLIPTECARLQGFADWWAHIEPKDNLTDEEYRFWLEVRNTHAAINGKPTKEYTKAQILTWYNKLYTDSAEYKMWGNGIALPPALYVLQGIADVLSGEQPLTPEDVDSALLQAYDVIAENEGDEEEQAEPTDLSDAPEDIKAEIIENAEKPEGRETAKATTEEETMKRKNSEEQATAKENTPADFCAVAQLRRLAEERKALANLRPEDPRFSNDVRAIEYAVNVLEAVGL